MHVVTRIARTALAGLVSMTVVATIANADEPAARVAFGGVEYLHRWSKEGQHEYTPKGQEDLERWRDMLTINVHETVTDGEGLADLANRVLGRYQSAGEILHTNSTPRTDEREAEHFAVAVLNGGEFLEAAFARFVLRDGVGYVIVVSHRIYGADAATKLGEWVRANGQTTEERLMTFSSIPSVAELRRLPQK